MTDYDPPVATLRRSRRVLLILFGFVVWALFITIRMSRFMVFDRGEFLAAMSRESWREAEIPPLRGRILDRDGKPLAWSTRHFVLLYRVPDDEANIRADLARIGESIPGLVLPDVYLLLPLVGEEVTLSDDLDASQTAALTDLAAVHSGLRVTTRFVRHRHPDPRVRARIGELETVDGILCGVSGEEKKHEHLLRGVPGRFRVMVDRKDRWIEQSWERVRELQPGYDVYVSLRVGDATTGEVLTQ